MHRPHSSACHNGDIAWLSPLPGLLVSILTSKKKKRNLTPPYAPRYQSIIIFPCSLYTYISLFLSVSPSNRFFFPSEYDADLSRRHYFFSFFSLSFSRSPCTHSSSSTLHSTNPLISLCPVCPLFFFCHDCSRIFVCSLSYTIIITSPTHACISVKPLITRIHLTLFVSLRSSSGNGKIIRSFFLAQNRIDNFVLPRLLETIAFMQSTDISRRIESIIN